MVSAGSRPIAAFVIDDAGRIASWNSACEQLLGYPADQILHQALDTIIAVKTSKLRTVLSVDNPPVIIARRLRHQDGSEVSASLSLLPQSRQDDTCPSRIALILPTRPDDKSSQIKKLINSLPGPFYVLDTHGNLVLWNRKLAEVMGKTTRQLKQAFALDFFEEPDRTVIRAKMKETLKEGHAVTEATLITKGGVPVPYIFTCSRIMLNRKPCVCGMGVEIAERKGYEDMLRLRERAIQASHSGVVITRCAGKKNLIEYVNPAFERITGYDKDEAIGRDPNFMRAPDVDEQQTDKIRAALRARQGVHVVLRNLRRNGEIFWNDLKIDPVVNTEGKVTHYVGVITDVTASKQSENHLTFLASHDALTGLANRSLMREHLERAIHHAHRHHELVALVFIDLDKFKQINDTLGHDAGDQVLKTVAARLRSSVRDSDIVARLGGDEFVLVLANQPSLDSIADLVDRLHRCVAEAMPFISENLMPTVSAGISVYPHDGEDVQTLMRNADAAMYHAKALGRNNYQFYSPELHLAAHQRIQQELSLRHAIEQGQLFLLYQPRVNGRSGKIVGAEALVRWHHPEQGVLRPDAFLPLAEDSGLILEIGDWVLAQVCQSLRQFRAAGMPDFPISINLSARQLKQKDFASHILEHLRSAGLPASCLQLELTENQLMENPGHMVEVFRHLKEQGLSIAIDNFGSGFSCLSYLEKLPIDHLKIDSSFVHNIGRGENTSAIAMAVIALAHHLKAKVVAEGVETEDQFEFLRRHECDEMQGYYFSEPIISRPLQDLVRNSAMKIQ